MFTDFADQFEIEEEEEIVQFRSTFHHNPGLLNYDFEEVHKPNIFNLKFTKTEFFEHIHKN